MKALGSNRLLAANPTEAEKAPALWQLRIFRAWAATAKKAKLLC